MSNRKDQLDAFYAWWLHKHAEDPENFPLDINPGDWDEQLELYYS